MMQPNRYQRRICRPGHTLLELMVSMVSATVLMGGLASSVLIASRAFDGSSAAADRTRGADVQAQMLRDLSLATSFSSRTSDGFACTVPDRDGDGNEESITYDWSAGSNNLSYTYNGSAKAVVLEDVTGFQLSYANRFMVGEVQAPLPYDANEWGNRWLKALGDVVFEEFTEAQRFSNEYTLSIAKPPGTAEGDLLIAALCTDGVTDVTMPSGWNGLVEEVTEYNVTFAVAWKIASASETNPYVLSWTGTAGQQAYGWIMRFTGHDPANPIHAWAATALPGTTTSPTCPSVNTTIDKALILRLGGFNDDDIVVDSPGLTGHTAITMDRSSTGSGTCSGGAGFFVLPAAGSSGQSAFSLTKKENAIVVTIAIAPGNE